MIMKRRSRSWDKTMPHIYIFSDIERKPSFIYAVALNDLCGLENMIKVTQFKLGLRLALVLRCTKFCKNTSQIVFKSKRGARYKLQNYHDVHFPAEFFFYVKKRYLFIDSHPYYTCTCRFCFNQYVFVKLKLI